MMKKMTEVILSVLLLGSVSTINLLAEEPAGTTEENGNTQPAAEPSASAESTETAAEDSLSVTVAGGAKQEKNADGDQVYVLDQSSHMIAYNISYDVRTVVPLPAGSSDKRSLEIHVPASVLTDGNGNHIDEYTVSLPSAGYVFYLDNKNTPDDASDDEIVICNTTEIAQPSGTFTITYSTADAVGDLQISSTYIAAMKVRRSDDEITEYMSSGPSITVPAAQPLPSAEPAAAASAAPVPSAPAAETALPSTEPTAAPQLTAAPKTSVKSSVRTYTVTFNPGEGTWDDGTGDVRNVTSTVRVSFAIPQAPVREGYVFAGWKGKSTFQPGQYYNEKNETGEFTSDDLTAVWKEAAETIPDTSDPTHLYFDAGSLAASLAAAGICLKILLG